MFCTFCEVFLTRKLPPERSAPQGSLRAPWETAGSAVTTRTPFAEVPSGAGRKWASLPEAGVRGRFLFVCRGGWAGPGRCVAAAAPGAEEGPAAMAVSESQLKKMLTKVTARSGAPRAPAPRSGAPGGPASAAASARGWAAGSSGGPVSPSASALARSSGRLPLPVSLVRGGHSPACGFMPG